MASHAPAAGEQVVPIRSPPPVAVLLAAALVPALVPVAGADDSQLWQCDDPPQKVAEHLAANAVPFLLAVAGQYALAAGKAKCTAFETLGVCQDESVPFTPGQPATTGGAHPRRGLCYEYPLQPGAGTIRCAAGEKIEHRESFDFHRHACVPLGKL